MPRFGNQLNSIPLKVVTVDDEPFALQRISRLVRGEPSFSLVAECGSPQSAIDTINEKRPNLVFLDVQMPEIDGFGVLDQINQDALPWVIFVTAYEEYAVRAFETNALDYLLKPISPERFKVTVGKIQSFHSDPVRSGIKALLDQSRFHRLVIKTDGKYVMLNPADVERVSAAGNYAIIYAAGRSYIVRETMTSLQCRLDPSRFFRVNRSEILNLSFVQELTPTCHGEYEIKTVTGWCVNLTRTYKDALQQVLPSVRTVSQV